MAQQSDLELKISQAKDQKVINCEFEFEFGLTRVMI